MTQREYISASLKIIGLVVLIYGCLTASRNLLQGTYSLHQSKQISVTYADSIPVEMKKEFDDKNKSESAGNQLMSVMYLSRIPANLVVVLFGLALIKRDRWFTTLLIGKDK